ncbi:VanZ family protein [Paenibacillus wynnii]|uniref:VanZ family protein n=1 Tax=Paenibacillus wynnii TaxID=268407 RepID=UPI00278F70B7|nr:VanZ family protein [Paenibacillus wynnii]MDQ0193271.1 glycopeptide antibiotics resistance protein [Paenibacillus wynnii]
MFKKALFNNRILNIVFLAIGMTYLLIMIKLLFLRGRHFGDYYMFNLMPFRTINNYLIHREHFPFHTWFENLIGNVVLFIPMGSFIPVLNRTYFKTLKFLAMSLTILFSVELIQMLTWVGSFDIDDIILNNFGALIGLIMTRIIL